MTVEEFNEKYKDYLEKGFYGLAINNQEVIKFLDKQFKSLIKTNIQPFKYSQIKTKFGHACVYCNAIDADVWGMEQEINKILKR